MFTTAVESGQSERFTLELSLRGRWVYHSTGVTNSEQRYVNTCLRSRQSLAVYKRVAQRSSGHPALPPPLSTLHGNSSKKYSAVNLIRRLTIQAFTSRLDIISPDESQTISTMRHAKSLNFPSKAAKLIIPDLISDCPFSLHLNPDGASAGINSDAWLSTKGGLGAKKQGILRGLKCGLLAAMTYLDAPLYELRTCCDFLSFLFHLDNLPDEMEWISAGH
ncbi:hypothetical protein EW145_g7847 [Phellinidium pouzarii]|uniref:Uncharacterized protein n=1 Tax=Phellinidium pouzarii TaxID=167371 RepID=A0A4S4KDB7_9AGAM|nr:hypothetical protein EW145_g7847 [Phellinidium pouzarii]